MFGFGYGAIPTFYTENFPTRYRASGASAAYQIAQVYGGGLIPILAGLILEAYGIQRAYIFIGLLVMVYAVMAIFAILSTPETKDVDLETDAPRRLRLWRLGETCDQRSVAYDPCRSEPYIREPDRPVAPVTRIATGFEFTEGPIWHPGDRTLLFSDMPADVRRRWDQMRGVAEVRRPSNKCNGMTYDADLNLIVCEHATSLLVRERPDGQRTILASHFEGKELNSPNDVCVRSDGSIYFTDPWYGRMRGFGVERPRQLGFQGVYRLAEAGAPELLVERDLFDQPNGLCFSPDEATLYVNDTPKALIRAFAVARDGSLSNGRVFAAGIRSDSEAGVPDGMKCDAAGNIWVTAPGGVWVYAPSGELIGKAPVPEPVANLNWGGADFRTLFLTATRSVYAVATRVGPHREPYMGGAAR